MEKQGPGSSLPVAMFFTWSVYCSSPVVSSVHANSFWSGEVTTAPTYIAVEVSRHSIISIHEYFYFICYYMVQKSGLYLVHMYVCRADAIRKQYN